MKHNIFRTALASAVLIFATSLAAMAGSDEKFTSVDKLPSQAQKFIAQHYPSEAVISVQKDVDKDKDYQVIFKNGSEILFDTSGKLVKLTVGQGAALPSSLASLLPAGIGNYLKDNYPGAAVTSLEPDGKGWRVGVAGQTIKLVFDKKGQYLGAGK